MSPANSARTPSTAQLNGLNWAMVSSHCGANSGVIGSRIPDSSSTGTATVFITGASASSLRRCSATAYETDEVISEINASIR